MPMLYLAVVQYLPFYLYYTALSHLTQCTTATHVRITKSGWREI